MSRSTPPDGMRDFGMVIDGTTVDAHSGDTFTVTYPYTGEPWARVPHGTSADVSDAVAAAHRRFTSESWQSMTPTERGELLFELADVIEDHIEELARLETFANGKLFRAMRSQMEALPDWYRYYGGLADKISGKTLPVDMPNMFNYTLREPYGVVGAITAWNSPLMLATYKIAPAIAAGNTVVLKPSEITPVSAIRFAELALEAGWPSGALNVVTGFGEAGAALTDHESVRKVAFTGGLETGRQVGKSAGETISPVTLELGGKSPNIVFPDAEIENAITGVIKGIFAATGQTCIAGSRLYLHESIHDAFLERLTRRTEALQLGDPFSDSTHIAPIACQQQFEKVEEYVDIARSEGARLVTGGEPREDLSGELFYPPTVFADVTDDMRIAREEVFGPVLSVLSFESESAVLERANDSRYGLAAGVWTSDLRLAHRMADRLEAGVVWVNTYRQSSYTTPFGGHKQSGVGVEKGIEAIDEYLQTKSVWIETEGEVGDPFTLV